MDKPLSQERLKEEEIQRIESYLFKMEYQCGTDITKIVIKMLSEVKRLQAIETALTEIATSEDPYYIWKTSHQQYARNILNIGADTNETH